MKKLDVVICVAGALTVAAGVYSYIKIKNKKETSQKPRQETVFSVTTKTLEIETLHEYVITNGEVESASSIDIYPDQDGILVETLVSLGDKVQKGQVIAKVDPSTPGSYFINSPVISKISGSVLTTPVKKGSKVTRTTYITTIGDINNLQVTASIPERYSGFLKPGLKADVYVQAYPEEAFKATVTKVSPVIDPEKRAKEIILSFDKKDSRINAGMFSQVYLFTRDLTGTVCVDSSSIVNKNDKSYVFVVNADSTVTETEVKTGLSVDSMIQITEGLKPGDKIVSDGVQSLSTNAKIKDITQNVINQQEK